MNYPIPTDISGFEYLLKSHRLVTIAGRYGHGADILAAQFARHAAVDHGIPTAFTSCWSSEDEITARLISAQAGVDLMHIRRDTCTAEESRRIAEADGALSDGALFINADLTLDGMAEHAAKTRARLAVVEGAHLLDVKYPPGREEPSAEDRASDLSRELKILAMRLEIPVVATIPLVAHDHGPVGQLPVMADLEDCWSFAGDSDTLIMTFRPDLIDGDNRPNEIDLIVAKDRHGSARTVTARVHEPFQRISDFPPGNVINFPTAGAS